MGTIVQKGRRVEAWHIRNRKERSTIVAVETATRNRSLEPHDARRAICTRKLHPSAQIYADSDVALTTAIPDLPAQLRVKT